MKKLLNKKIPTILGIILILLGIPLTTFIIKNQTIFKSNASNSQEPQSVKITNISDKSFTITYQTDVLATGSINYGINKNLGESGLDDADKEKGSFSPKKIHSISIKKLIPITKYYLTIISGSDTFLNNDALFETATGPNISSGSANKGNIVKGRIILPDGSAPLEALVYLNAENSQLLSGTTAKDGKFSFSLKDLRTNNLSSYFSTQDNTIFTIFATDGSLKSTVLTSLGQANSIPTITLSNDYDFVLKTSPVASQSAQPLNFPTVTPSQKTIKPQILNPKQNQSFNSQKPKFNGTSLPNEKVEIIIHSDEQITTQVTADNNGNWTYQSPNNLSPGAHTITMKTRDSSGILTTVMQSFTVFAAETPSLTPTAYPATPIPSVLPALMPTGAPSPTIPVLIPLATPTSSPVIVPIGSKGGLPPTGTPPTLLIIGGAVISISSLLFFLLF